MVRAGKRTYPLSANISASPVVTAGQVKFGNDLPISIIAGPCQLESRSHALEVASALKEIAARLKIGLVYKTSFDKANRSSGSAAARHRACAGVADLRRDTFFARTARAHRRARGVAMRRGGAGGGRVADPGLPVPADRFAAGGGGDRQGRQRQEGAVPGAVGHGQCRRQDHRRRQSRTCWSPNAARPLATTRWCRTCARCRSWRAPPARR